jgi:hypothetical protein
MSSIVLPPLPINSSFSTFEAKLSAIAHSSPSVQRACNSSNKPSQTNLNLIDGIVKMWISSFLRNAIASTHIDTEVELYLLKISAENGWKDHAIYIFKVLAMPLKYTYPILEAVWDLDSLLYKTIYPFPVELEKSLAERKQLEAIAAAPLKSS